MLVRRGASPLEMFAQDAQVLVEAKEALPLAVVIHICKSTDQYLFILYLNKGKGIKVHPRHLQIMAG